MGISDRFAAALAEKSPSRLFLIFIILHLSVWTLIPALFAPNAPLDVIEGYAWGREWLIGTHKHPPMQAWLLEILALITDRASWAHFLASQIAIVVAFWAVWRTGCRLTDDKTALIGAMLLEGVAYYTFGSTEFNPNILQIPFWALICWSFHRAVKENLWFDWLLLGIWAAGGIYSKYSVFVLLAVIGMMMLIVPEARRRFRGLGPYLTFATAFLLFLPHLRWLIINDFSPFVYANSRIIQAARWQDYITNPIGFAAAQAAIMTFMAALFLLLSNGKISCICADKSKQKKITPTFDEIFLHSVTLGPFLIILLFSAITGERPRDAWGSCLWNFSGLWVLVNLMPKTKPYNIRRFAIGWMVVFAVSATASLSGFAFLDPMFMKKLGRVYFPGQALSEVINKAWQKRYKTALKYVAGDIWLAGNVAYYSSTTPTNSRPHVLISGDYTISPWIDRTELSANGGVLVWCADHCSEPDYANKIPQYLNEKFPNAEIQPPLTLKQQTFVDVFPVIIGWAVVPPQ